MNKTRVETVAHAIATYDPQHDPGYYAGRYAVRDYDREGPDVGLANVGPSVRLDIAGWTCYSYPDLCESVDPDEITGHWYWRNAKEILGLTSGEADLLFLGVTDGKHVADYASETAIEAAGRLRSLAQITKEYHA